MSAPKPKRITDKQRLDWIVRVRPDLWCWNGWWVAEVDADRDKVFEEHSLRAAIDKAMRGSK